MTSRLPHFKSIEAFVVAGKTLSFTEAALGLHLTVPAISRRIQALEAELGVALFQRTHRSLRLTDEGEDYLSQLLPAMETLRSASDRIRAKSREQSLTVRLPASLAANWLIERLPRFHGKHRGIRVELETGSDRFDLDGSGVDLAIWLGTGNWQGLRAERLLDVEAFPVCSADFLSNGQKLQSSRDLLKYPLLGIAGEHELWSEWLHAAGLPQPDRVGHAFDDMHLLYRAAASGLGIALGIDVLVKPYLEEARLIRPVNTWFKLTKGYYVICRGADWARRPVSTFREWLLSEARGGSPPKQPGVSQANGSA